MKNINSRQVVRMVNYIKSNNKNWYEGLSFMDTRLIIFNFKLKPRYYWMEGESYILHRQGSNNWYCISADYYNKELLKDTAHTTSYGAFKKAIKNI